MKMVIISGEAITEAEAEALDNMIRHDAMQIAGVFHEMERSEKFRVNWPNDTIFAESEWKSFVEAVRLMYTERLADPHVPHEDKHKMHLAIVRQEMKGLGREKDNRLQLAPNTQQFVGDKFENKKILENYGMKPNFRAQLRAGAAKIVRMH